MKEFSYETQDAPADYVCEFCKAKGVKLWRGYNDFFPKLSCFDCSIKNSNRFVIQDIDTNGCSIAAPSEAEVEGSCLEVCLGWYNPAVPSEDNQAYWGLTSTPKEAWAWWKGLASR